MLRNLQIGTEVIVQIDPVFVQDGDKPFIAGAYQGITEGEKPLARIKTPEGMEYIDPMDMAAFQAKATEAMQKRQQYIGMVGVFEQVLLNPDFPEFVQVAADTLLEGGVCDLTAEPPGEQREEAARDTIIAAFEAIAAYCKAQVDEQDLTGAAEVPAEG
jgi:hypothetical protein